MMSNTTTSIGLLVLLIICILLGYEFVSFEQVSDESSLSPQEDLAPRILEEIKRLDEELKNLKTSKADQHNPYDPDELQNFMGTFYESFSEKFLRLVDESLGKLQLPDMTEENNVLEEPEKLKLSPPTLPTPTEEFKTWKNYPLADRVGVYRHDQCEKKDKIYFLKTSKTGSTTMANILMRFGYSRPGTNFLMGESPNGAMFFLNGYMPFNEGLCYMGRDIPNRPKFDISYVHMRYNKTAIDDVMHPNTFKVSILRDPLDNFMSSWKYYNGLTKEMRVLVNKDIKPTLDMDKNPDWYKEIEQFLSKPWEYLYQFAYSHSAYLFVVNPQFIFFGYPSYLLRNTQNRLIQLVDNWIQQIDSDFDHIIILEDVDRSLAVLMLKLCWEIDDVVHLKLNQMTKDGKSINMMAKRKLRELNWADYRLYEYFKKKLDREVKAIGEDRVARITNEIVKRAEEVTAECLQPDKTTGWISSPIVKPEKRHNQTCYMYVKDISGYIEADQYIRWKNEHPEWRMSQTKMKSRKFKGRKLANFCGPNESFPEWLSKKDKEFRDFLKWPTNEFDFRNYTPEYLQEFAKEPQAGTETSDGYYKIFN